MTGTANFTTGELLDTQKRWYAVYTRPHHEKKVAEGLETQAIDHYLPLVKECHRWADRKKVVEVPLIRGYVFVHIILPQSLYVLETYGVVRFVTFKQKYAPIPDFQIEALQRTLETGYQLTPTEYLAVGQLVEVIEGPLQGTIGRIQCIQNEKRFVISLDAIQTSYMVQINPDHLRPLSAEKRQAIFTLPLGM